MSVLGTAFVNFQVLGDQPVEIKAGKYIIRSVIVLEAQPFRPSGAAAGLFTGPNGGGLCIVSHTQGFDGAGGDTFEALAMTSAAAARVLSDPVLYLRLNTACTVPSMGRLIVYGEKL